MGPTPQPLANLRCPLCGGPNACAPAASGRFDSPCWCKTASFDFELLNRLAAADRGVACICSRCAAIPAAALAPSGK